jgi:serine phosphatase RsbU (regulator of sigma subunit)
MDNILCHVDKDGRPLCGEEFCPLHRCMVTDTRSVTPIIVFGLTKSGIRIPMEVSVAPIHDSDGHVVGGVETFRDFTESFIDQERARRIQTLSLEYDLPKDPRARFDTFYLPHDMIGGDFYAIRSLDADHYGFFLADVMGHGEAAALHTMHLSSLWNRYCHTLKHPAQFAKLLNRDLCKVVKDESFATGICGVLDLASKTVRIASAGGPPVVLVRAAGQAEQSSAQGFPFGMIAGSDYDEDEFHCAPGDSLLIFTDGAFEISDAVGRMLGIEGLLGILNSLGHPKERIDIETLEKALLCFSNEIRLNDDLSLIDIRIS